MTPLVPTYEREQRRTMHTSEDEQSRVEVVLCGSPVHGVVEIVERFHDEMDDRVVRVDRDGAHAILNGLADALAVCAVARAAR
jgi:hypothetical protein